MLSFPKYDISLHIDHNRHKGYYETVESALRSGTYDKEDFISEEEMNKAIELDSVWDVQWYPNTPVGFHIHLASDLEVLLKFINENYS